MGVNTNPDISATCTVTADGGILPLYLIYPEGQIKHVTGNSAKQQRQAISGTNNSVTNHNNNNSNNVTYICLIQTSMVTFTPRLKVVA